MFPSHKMTRWVEMESLAIATIRLLSMVVRRTTTMGFSLAYFLNLKLAFSFAIVSYIYIYFHLSTLSKKKRQKKFISFSWF